MSITATFVVSRTSRLKATRLPSGERVGAAAPGATSPEAMTEIAAFGAAVSARTKLRLPGESDEYTYDVPSGYQAGSDARLVSAV